MHKKIIAIMAIMLAIPAVAFSGQIDAVKDFTPGTDWKFQPANNVQILYDTDTSATSHQDFTISSKNNNGDIIYSSSNGTTSIWTLKDKTWKGQSLYTDLNANHDNLAVGESTYTGWTGI
ncbi:MAG TPA: hypothetical protein DCO77_07305 [Nitrospiraceae bacterium]|nr:hypothetical protein [Nitrospiraceae bacterium]